MSSTAVVFAVLNHAGQVAVAALIVAALVRLLGRHRPHLALLLWTLVFIKCLTPPVWSSPVGLFSWLQLRVEAAEQVLTGGPNAASFEELAAVRESALPVIVEAGSRFADRFWISVANSLVAVWLAGALGVFLMVVLSWRRCRRQIRESQVECDPSLRRQIEELGCRLGLRCRVELIVCEAAFGPAAAGILRPQLILPHRLIIGRRFEQLEAIVAHELIHLRRHDPVLLVIELTAKVLWWFHPLVWHAGRQTARLRERCCDAETVVGLGCRPANYARSLLDVLEHLQVCRGLSMAPGVRPAEVTLERLETIMRESDYS
jgi:beta-lactamase regulating signal transducer with metallopeptidase domain